MEVNSGFKGLNEQLLATGQLSFAIVITELTLKSS